LYAFNLAQTNGIPQAIIPGTKLILLTDHPVLWSIDNSIFFSVISKAANIAELMGDLFIAHSEASGNWVSFHSLYSGLPTVLETERKNQFTIPKQLERSCFDTLTKYCVTYQINTVEISSEKYKVLFFSNEAIWRNEANFGQSYIIAKQFYESRLK
jgi:hypothetical protein